MIGIYLSGTGNTKHCVEKLVNLIDDKSKCVPLEFPQIIDLLKKERSSPKRSLEGLCYKDFLRYLMRERGTCVRPLRLGLLLICF